MGSVMMLRLLAATVLVGVASLARAGQGGQPPDAIELFVGRLEQLASAGDSPAILGLAHPSAEMTGIEEFAGIMSPAPSRIAIRERDRTAGEAGEQQLLLELLVERGIEGRVSTWRVDLVPGQGEAAGQAAQWRLARVERLSVVSGLYKLSLDTTRQYDVKGLSLTAPDLSIEMPSGTAFLASTPEGPTGVVLLGRGRMRFAPPDDAERIQVHIFSGSDVLQADFDAAFIRVRPSEFESRFRPEALTLREVSSGAASRARGVFDDYVGQTLQIDLQDLSRERWSLVPNSGDLIAEVRTRRHGSLTYARAWGDAEDISVFDRRRRRNIAVYASAEKLAARGRFYSEDDLVDYDVLDYEIDASFDPERTWIAGSARLTVRIRAPLLSGMTLKLAEALTVRGVYSPTVGRLLHLRVVGQNSLILNLPSPAPRNTEIALVVVYSGRLEPQELEREAIAVSQQQVQELPVIPLEPRYIYSNRSYWYPQSTVTDYATAKLRLTVPPEYDVVASGIPSGPPAPAPGPVAAGSRPRRVFVFESDRPARYLACVISRFSTVTTAEISVPASELHGENTEVSSANPGPSREEDVEVRRVALVVQANPRQTGRARALSQQSTSIFEFYAGLVGEAPYSSFTLAVTESELPGGHSPPYFAVLNQSLPTSPIVWRNDPVSFDNYPTFFLAHELAHQWWGQAVGWKNYHEQWISEGFAQYFATLYAEKERGRSVLTGILRQMRKWAVDESDQGPVYLGYRLGHIKGEGRVFRALLYNKAAMVLHMLRRLVGDEAFFAGVRRFYTEWRFKKAGTDDFRAAMETESRQDLGRFFDAWIYGAAVPRLKFSSTVTESGTLLVRFEHKGEVVPVPVTVTLTYDSGATEEVIVPVTERVVERKIPLREALRKADANEDHAAVAEVDS